jgi:hypothetical protein
MGYECTLLHLQELVTGSYPEPKNPSKFEALCNSL